MTNKISKKALYITIYSFILLITWSGCTNKQEYSLTGTINPMFDNQNIMLFSFKGDSIYKVDTCIISKGEFQFHGTENLEDIAILTKGNYPDTVVSQLLFLDKGKIEVSLDSQRVRGTELNNLFQGYQDSVRMFSKEIRHLNEIENNPDGIFSEEFSSYKKIIEFGQYTVNFKRRNINNLVGQYYFQEEAGKRPYEWYAYPSTSCPDSAFFIIYHAADSAYQQKEWIRKYMNRLKEKEKGKSQKEQLLGENLIDFTLTDEGGNSKRISSYIGSSEYIYLDFWASWCGPCIAEFPELKILYEKYDRSILEIIGISLDTSEKSWKNALDRLDAPWVQLLTGTSQLEKEVREAYAIDGIPFGLLLDKKGCILEIQSQHTLDEKLESLITK